MRGSCFYCKNEAEVEEFKNPHTKQIQLTCAKCKNSLSLYVRQRNFYPKLGYLGTPLFIILGIISFAFVNWQVGTLMVAIAISVGILSYVCHNYYITKWGKELGTYVDKKKIKWCKTCVYFREVKQYEHELWQSEEMIMNSKIPCKILQDTKPVWVAYFSTEVGKRTLYPKDCDRWTRK